MLNPFDIIIEKLEGLESKIVLNNAVPTSAPTEIIDRGELCKRLAITEPTAIRWERKGRLPSFRIGSNVRYNWKRVIEVLEGKKGVDK